MTSQMMMSFYEGSLPSMGPHGRTILRVIFRKLNAPRLYLVCPIKTNGRTLNYGYIVQNLWSFLYQETFSPGMQDGDHFGWVILPVYLLTVSLTLRDFTAMDFYEDMDAPRQMVDTLFRTKLCKSYAIKEDEIGDAVLTMRFKKRGHTLFKLTCMYPSTLFTGN